LFAKQLETRNNDVSGFGKSGGLMVKKRFLLAILLVILALISVSQVFAGCCQGIIGCSRAFFETECSSLATFDVRECEEIKMCDVVACCHNITGIPRATYRATCFGMEPTPTIIRDIKTFTTNPAAESAYAASLCAGAKPPCTYVNCEQANTADCSCGATVTTSGATYCCSRDSSVFSSAGICAASPSCKIVNFYSISGKVKTPLGVPVVGAQVRAGGKQVLTDSDGNYTISSLPDLSSGTVVAIKNSTINSTTYTISGKNEYDLVIILDIPLGPPIGIEICTVTDVKDDDGDQFYWKHDMADKCDSDCPPYISKTVTEKYFRSQANGGEFGGTNPATKDKCSDKFDNDCDGTADCDDTDCANSPACLPTECGDGVVQFPNADGIYEQCDYYDDQGNPITNGTHIIGDDSLCPGKCIRKGDSKQCTCKYEAVCGNDVIDPPLEDCDGVFLAPLNKWSTAKWKPTSKCTDVECGKPGSKNPCQCPPPQVCGDGKVDAPEQCDPGGIDGAQEAANNCDGCSPDCSCPPTAAVCGNGILEYGEDCDGNVDTAQTDWEPDTFRTRKYGCERKECAIPKLSQSSSTTQYPFPAVAPKSSGIASSYDPQYKKAYADYLSDLEVDKECRCPTECGETPSRPVVKPVKQVRYKRAIQINWTDECMNENAQAYNVLRCEAQDEKGKGCSPTGTFTAVNSAPLGITNKFVDTTFKGSRIGSPRYYCYKVEGVYGDVINPDKTTESQLNTDIHCIKAGMEECYEFHEFYPWAEEFCSGLNYNVRYTCDENNTAVEVTDTEITDCNVGSGSATDLKEYVCVGPFSNENDARYGETQCVPKSICDYCNDPFGLFGFSGDDGYAWGRDDVDLLNPFDYGMAPTAKPLDSEKTKKIGYDYCIELDFCYMDYSYTNINKFYSRHQNNTCYDFHSLQACMDFNKTDGNCDWAWHPLYEELGVGICRTNITSKQECERCHDPENEVFNRCDRAACSLYGRCYYDKENLGEGTLYASLAMLTNTNQVKRAQKDDQWYYRCTHERNISCEHYDSMEDCIGSHSPYSVAGTVNQTSNVVIDVSGNVSKEVFMKIAGSHKIVTKSDDFFGFGKCEWSSEMFRNISRFDPAGKMFENVTSTAPERCIKNSDDSPPEHTLTISTSALGNKFKEKLEIETRSDCGGGDLGETPLKVIKDLMACRKDFDPPVTTIPHYQNLTNPMREQGNFSFPATVSDASSNYSTHYPDTYACISNDTYTCYPNGTAKKIDFVKGNLIEYDSIEYNLSYDPEPAGKRKFKTGRYIIWYFSEDISHNLELVRNFTVFIDADAPNISLSFSNISYEREEDVWRTNLTLTMQVVQQYADDDKYAMCNAKMYLGNNSIYRLQDIINEYNNTWTRNYTGMYDDRYTFWYRCVDDVGNIAEANVTILVDGDLSITNPTPTGTYNTTKITIGVETGTNAECRYLHWGPDDPRFWPNKTFDTSVFDNKMTKFDVTGTATAPTTIHKSNPDLKPGYQRFYVKCKMFNDGKIRGNNADQIRFAIDTQGPTTQHSTDSIPYNSWYNKDIKVSLLCADPPVMGASFDWKFGCNKSYYCIGKGCSGFANKFENYTKPIKLNKTTYLTYYSVDKGGNAGLEVKDVLFQIDKEPPNITIEFFEGTARANVFVPNMIYKIRVSSSKPFISPAVESPTLTYSSQPAKFAGTIKLFPTLNTSVWEGMFFIEYINANMGFEGLGTFKAAGTDYHNVSGSGSASITIDTKPPAAPVLKPSLEKKSPAKSEYQQLGYPIHYYNGTYYTNQNTLFITGYTAEFLDMIAVTTVDGVDAEHIFTQTPTKLVYNDSVLSGFKDNHEMKILGDITSRVNASLYLDLDKVQTRMGSREDYGAYGTFYDTTNFVYKAGDDRYTVATIYPGLEKTLKLDDKIFFYDKENPSLWFGFNISTPSFKNTTFYLKAYDNATNIVRYPAISRRPSYLTFFADPVSPTVLSHYPRAGSTSKTDFDIQILVKEGKQESGLFNASVNFTLNDKAVTPNVEYDTTIKGKDNQSDYYRIYYTVSGIADGVYDVSISGKDLALNSFSETTASASWTFEVDRSLPADPDFSLIGGFPGPPGTTRWFVKNSPDFIVNFSDESNPVTITDVVMKSAPTEGGAAKCTNISFNAFLCKFTTPKTAGGSFWADYGVTVKAYKTLDDNTRSNTGSFGPFEFTVDDQAPKYTLAMKTRFMDNINLTIGAIVSNEKHTLYADLEILGKHYRPLYTSNNGSFYYFVWSVPDYKKSQEGNTSMKITLSDFAGNARSKTIPVHVDLTAPRIVNISIDISNTVKIGTELFTAYPNVSVSGRFIDDDIDRVWIVPGDYNDTTGKFTDKKYADITYKGGSPKYFNVSVRLFDPRAGTLVKSHIVYNYMLINQINNMTLFVRDKAGHVSSRNLKVISDVTPPLSPSFCLGDDWQNCLPGVQATT
jgi:hypothetical protein